MQLGAPSVEWIINNSILQFTWRRNYITNERIKEMRLSMQKKEQLIQFGYVRGMTEDEFLKVAMDAMCWKGRREKKIMGISPHVRKTMCERNLIEEECHDRKLWRKTFSFGFLFVLLFIIIKYSHIFHLLFHLYAFYVYTLFIIFLFLLKYICILWFNSSSIAFITTTSSFFAFHYQIVFSWFPFYFLHHLSLNEGEDGFK